MQGEKRKLEPGEAATRGQNHPLVRHYRFGGANRYLGIVLPSLLRFTNTAKGQHLNDNHHDRGVTVERRPLGSPLTIGTSRSRPDEPHAIAG